MTFLASSTGVLMLKVTRFFVTMKCSIGAAMLTRREAA